MKCQAHKTNGDPCNAQAIRGKRVCRVHGGLTPSGLASPHYTHGRYSKALPARLAARYDEATTDPALLELRADVALLDARLADILTRVDTGESGALWGQLKKAHGELIIARGAGDTKAMATSLQLIGDLITQGHADYRAWQEIGALLEQRRKLVESERKRLIEAQQTLTVEKAMLLIGAISGIIKAHVHDRAILAAIGRDIEGLVSREDAALAG